MMDQLIKTVAKNTKKLLKENPEIASIFLLPTYC